MNTFSRSHTKNTGEFSKFFSAGFKLILLITAFFLLFASACSFFSIINDPIKTSRPALILIPGTALLIAFLFSAYFISRKLSDKSVSIVTASILGLFSLICFIFLFNFRVFNNNDYAHIRDIISDILACREWDPYYVSKYPNNLPLLAMMLPVNRLADFLGIDRLFAEGLVNTLCTAGTAVFSTLVSEKIFGKRAGFITSLLFLMTIVLYPWTSNFYSDCPSMMLMMLGIFLFLKGLGSQEKAAKITLFCFSGAALAAAAWIRITAAFFLIGIIIYLICRKDRKDHILSAVSALTAFAAVFVLLTSAGNSLIPGSYDSESRKIPTIHWVMMGMNPDTNGSYSNEDVKYTESFSSYEEKVSGNMEMLKNRLGAHTPLSLTKFCLEKLRIMWSNGQHNIKNQAKQASDYGSLYQYSVGVKDDFFAYFNQTSWSALLLLALASAVFALFKKCHGLDAALQIGLFGFFLFYLIWETNRRYSLFCIPVLIVLASGAVRQLFAIAKNVFSRAERSGKPVFTVSYAALGVVFLAAMVASFGLKWDHYTSETLHFDKTAFLQRSDGRSFKLSPGDVYSETFPVSQEIDRITLMFSGEKENASGEFKITGETSDGEIIFEHLCQAEQLLKKKEYSFDTDSFIPDGKEYITLKVECISSGDKTISLRGETYYPCNDAELYKNGKLMPNASLMLRAADISDERFMSPGAFITLALCYFALWAAAFAVPVILGQRRTRSA